MQGLTRCMVPSKSACREEVGSKMCFRRNMITQDDSNQLCSIEIRAPNPSGSCQSKVRGCSLANSGACRVEAGALRGIRHQLSGWRRAARRRRSPSVGRGADALGPPRDGLGSGSKGPPWGRQAGSRHARRLAAVT